MSPEPTELLLIGCLTGLILIPKIQIKYIDTKNQLPDILTKGNFTCDEWNHLLSLFNFRHVSSTSCSEVMSKRTQKIQVKKVTAKWKPMMDLVSRCIERTADVLASTASESRWKPDIKVKYFWARGLSSSEERRDLFWTLTHQVTQCAMLTRSGLLKTGNLMNWWK